MSFEHLDQRDGLSNNAVLDIVEDAQGFMWFATENGLNRFNGYDVVRYQNDRRDPGSLPGDWVWQSVRDQAGDLWLATEGGGLVRWNHASGTFSSYRHDPEDPASLPSDVVRAVMIDAQGQVWVGTRGRGLARLDADTGVFTRYRHAPADVGSLSSDIVYALLPDSDGRVWVGTGSGLDVLDPGTGGFRHYRHDAADANSLSGNEIIALEQDHTGALWIGTFDTGLNRLDPVSDEIRRFVHDPDDPRSLSNDLVRTISADSQNRLWIGTEGGLNLLDRGAEAFTRYAHDRSDPSSLADSSVMSIFEDSVGNLWIGTRAGGVSRWNPRTELLGACRDPWLEAAEVTSFATDEAGVAWIGTMGAGLKRLELATGAVRHYRRDPEAPARGISDDMIMSLLHDDDGNLWVGTLTAGLNRIDAADGTITQFRHDPDDAATLGADGVMSMMQDRAGRIWVGTYGGGVSLFDPATGQFEPFHGDLAQPNGLHGSRATAIVQHPNDDVWVGTDGGGLYRLSAADGTVTNFRSASDETSLSSNAIFALHVDAGGRLWVGTADKGLDRVDAPAATPDGVRFDNVQAVRDLIGSAVFGIQSDAAGRIWMSTNDGIGVFEPVSASLKTLRRHDGLQGDDFNFGAHHRSADGHLFFGGTKGFNRFDPMSFAEDSREIPVVLTGFQIANRPVSTPQPYELLESIELDHGDKVVTFDFAGLDLQHARAISYAYRLDGFDDDWHYVGDRRRVTYTNLDAGSYTLQVKATNRHAFGAEAGLTLPVEVRPAPWATVWAYTAYVVACLAVVALVWRRHLQSLNRAANYRRELEREVKDRTRELEDQNRTLEELSRAKSEFLARMSHEIRTPLNGVLGIAELLLGNAPRQDRQRFATTMRSSSQALLDCIDDVLDVAKIEAGKLEVERIAFDLGALCEDTILMLRSAAADKGADVALRDADRRRPAVDRRPRRLRQVLVNLIGNAIKFTERGEVVARCIEQPGDPGEVRLRFEVSDTGIGISEKKQEHIFDAFTQEDDSTTRRYGGTGLGLAISRQLVELMGGEIGVDSTPGEGATFWFTAQFRPAPAGMVVDDTAGVAASRLRPSVAGFSEEMSGLQGRVLVVEDTRVNQTVVAAMLSRFGCAVDVAADGAAAVERAKAGNFDLILMDSHMPGMDGLRATQAIRVAEPPGHQTPIIALTADARPEHLQRCLEAGMNDCLTKPFSLQDLHAAIAGWLPVADIATKSASATDLAAGTVLNADSLNRLRTVFIPDNEQGLLDVIRAYLEESAGLIEDLGSAISLRDVSLVRTSSHTLKSSSAELGADGFAGVCQQLEHDAINDDLDDADALYKELVSLYPDVISALESESRKLAS